MPSTTLISQSGGVTLVSGNILSGQLLPVGGVNIKHSASGIGPVFVCITNLSGSLGTINSGGTLTSGGLADGWELSQGNTYFIPKVRLQASGFDSIRIHTPVLSSGTRIYWELT